MKIAVLSSGHIPSEWAHSINTMKHANGFAQINHEVTILTPLRKLENQKLQEINTVHNYYDILPQIQVKFFRDKLFYYSEVFLLKKIYKGLDKLTNNQVRYWWDIEKNMANYVLNNNFDLAYCRSFRGALYLIQQKFPVIVETHTPNVKNPSLKLLLNEINSPYFVAISTISEKIKQSFINYGVPQEKILVQEDAVDLTKFDIINNDKILLREQMNLPITKKIITYIGTLEQNRGIEEILYAAKQHTSLTFLIVGGKQKQVSYYQKYASLQNVIFTGHVSSNLVPKFLKASDVLLAPYSNKVYTAAHMSPIKMFEYLATKVPIIISDMKRIRDVVSENEVTFMIPDNGEDLTKKIQTVLNTPKLATHKALEAYKLSKEYTYRKRCENLLKYYNKNFK